jgi:hypothetical protein
MVTRIDFLGQYALEPELAVGARTKAMSNYLPGNWPGWSVDVKPNTVTFTGPRGQSIEMPRTACIIYRKPDLEAK